MKFTRTLALAFAAAAALSMTACDDDSSTSPAAGGLTVVELKGIGTQKHSDPSFVSIRKGAVYKSGTAADQVQANKDNVDIIVFADSTSPMKPSFFSPKRMTETFASAPSATLFKGTTVDTKFVNLGKDGEDVTFADIKTADDLSKLAADLPFGTQNDVLGLNVDDVVAVKLVDNTYALVKVTVVAASADYSVGVQLKYAK